MCEYRVSNKDIKSYFFAGKSILTIKNSKTGNHMTFKIIKKKSVDGVDPMVWWIMRKVNSNDYVYCCAITPKGLVSQNFKDVGTITIRFMLDHYLLKDNPLDTVEFYHEGRCPYCGREMTSPESLERGAGPVCSSRIVEQRKVFETMSSNWKMS